jgi:hypothetical protein
LVAPDNEAVKLSADLGSRPPTLGNVSLTSLNLLILRDGTVLRLFT